MIYLKNIGKSSLILNKINLINVERTLKHRAKKLAMNLLKVSNHWVNQNNGILGFMVSQLLGF